MAIKPFKEKENKVNPVASTLLATVRCPTTLYSRDSVEAGLLADEMKNF